MLWPFPGMVWTVTLNAKSAASFAIGGNSMSLLIGGLSLKQTGGRVDDPSACYLLRPINRDDLCAMQE
jgi:hypothetical protein